MVHRHPPGDCGTAWEIVLALPKASDLWLLPNTTSLTHTESLMTEWIPVIATLAGTVVGGIISYFAKLSTLAKQEKSERRSIILSKLEETHQVVRSIRQIYKETYSDMLSHLVTGLPLSKDTGGPVEIDRLAMLIGFYFPELSPEVEALEASRNRLGAILAKGIVAGVKPQGSNKVELVNELNAQYDEVNHALQNLLNSITRVARKHIKL